MGREIGRAFWRVLVLAFWGRRGHQSSGCCAGGYGDVGLGLGAVAIARWLCSPDLWWVTLDWGWALPLVWCLVCQVDCKHPF